MNWDTFITEPSFWIIVILIIVFSASFHKIFAQIFYRIYSWIKPKAKNTYIEKNVKQIEKAILSLRKSKTGATIVIENGAELSGYIVESDRIDSIISEKIITSIFNKKSPLHDGAIIIKGGRIAKASAFITKLSENNKVPLSFGTRHRSALGLSEVTSAIIIVISEESQKVTLFRKGSYKVIAISSLYSEILKEWKA